MYLNSHNNMQTTQAGEVDSAILHFDWYEYLHKGRTSQRKITFSGETGIGHKEHLPLVEKYRVHSSTLLDLADYPAHTYLLIKSSYVLFPNYID